MLTKSIIETIMEELAISSMKDVKIEKNGKKLLVINPKNGISLEIKPFEGNDKLCQ